MAAAGNGSRILRLHDEDDGVTERTARMFENMAEKAVAVSGGSSNVQRPYSYDPGHLAGSRQSESEAQQQGHQGTKRHRGS